MKKLLSLLLVAVMAVTALAACNTPEEEEPVVVNPYADLVLSDYIILGEYKTLTVSVEKEEITDDIVDRLVKYYFAQILEAKSTDRTVVEEFDTVTVNYTGYVDGEKLDNATATGAVIIIGYSSMIDGFVEGLVGRSLNEEFELNLKFDEDYTTDESLSHLNGKDVRFEIKITKIQETVIPSNDELAKEYGYDSYNEFVKAVRESAEASAENDYQVNLRDTILKAIQDACIKLELPQSVYEGYYNDLKETYASYVSEYNYYYGTTYTWQEYFKLYSGKTPETYCLDQVYGELVLLAVSQAENLQITEEFYEEEIQVLIEYYASLSSTKYTKAQIEELFGKELLEYQFLYDFTNQWLKENVRNTAAE